MIQRTVGPRKRVPGSAAHAPNPADNPSSRAREVPLRCAAFRLDVVVAALAMSSACLPIEAPSYPGETLAVLRGVVANPRGLRLGTDASMAARIVWASALDAGTTDPATLTANTTVETRLPADFTIALYTQPPPAAVEGVDGVMRARGDIVVVDDAQLASLGAGDGIAGVYGATDRFSLLWLASDDDAAAETAHRGYTQPLAGGFNLLAAGTSDDDEEEDDARALDVVPLTSVIVLELQRDER